MKNIFRAFTLASLFFVYPLQAQADSLLMPGELIYGHAKLEATCEECHTKFDKKAQSGLCAGCHKEVGKDIAEKRGYHGRLEAGKECNECHPDHQGRNAIVVTLDKEKFDHAKTDYPLKDGHADPKVKCESCHKADKKYSEAPSICNECHKKGEKHKGMMGTDCERCHSEQNWKKIVFDHNKNEYKLAGRHSDVKCIKCHRDDNYKKTPTRCHSCHKKNDKHKNSLGPKCETCHVENGWKEIIFDHDRQTKSPLRGRHKQAKCTGCHKSGKFTDKVSALCFHCHEKDDKHKSKFGPICDTCHNEKNWKETSFDHEKETDYPLLGKHIGLKCVNCHTGRMYENETFRSDCYYCHKKDDVHKGRKGKICESCHTEINWERIIRRVPK